MAAAVAVNGNIAYVTGVSGGFDQGAWIDRVEQSGIVASEFLLNGQHSNVSVPSDMPTGIAVSGAADVFVVGSTTSVDFPTTPNAPQPSYGSGASDAFISKVSFSDASPPPPPPPTGGSLPSPWIDQDIGAVGATGSASYSNGVFSVTGSGSDIWGSADSFNFTSRSIA